MHGVKSIWRGCKMGDSIFRALEIAAVDGYRRSLKNAFILNRLVNEEKITQEMINEFDRESRIRTNNDLGKHYFDIELPMGER